jgi:hypothetical protein
MAKKARYPAKFRQKLEKVAAQRDARTTETGMERIFATLYQTDVLLPGSVHLMHMKLDDDAQRMSTVYRLRPPPTPDYVFSPPPWPPIDPKTPAS